MVQTYAQWITESGMNRDLSSPISIEIEGGQVKVYANPEEENWAGESVRTELYQDLLDELQQAVKEKADGKIRSLLTDLRDLPLFSRDTSNAWKMAQVDGVEDSSKQALNRRSLALYCIRKIELFLDWIANQG